MNDIWALQAQVVTLEVHNRQVIEGCSVLFFHMAEGWPIAA